MNIIVDPYMLELEDENEIRDNLSFFRVLFLLCKDKRINLVLYKELVEKMLTREVKPFPIYMGQIKDNSLRNTIQLINSSFVNFVMSSISALDIESCSGDQNFEVESDVTRVDECLQNDEKYYELLSVLLQPCYNKKLIISDCIITGKKERGLLAGDSFLLKCQCSCTSTKVKYYFGLIEEIADEEDKAYLSLDHMISTGMVPFVLSPVIVRGDHHNKLQKNSDFTTYEGLSRVNKAVISVLRKFGLSKIIFGKFHEDSSRAQGSINVYDVQTTDSNDIVKGWLFAETGFKNHVDLYFPKGVGKNLKIYLKGEFGKNSVERLYDSLF